MSRKNTDSLRIRQKICPFMCIFAAEKSKSSLVMTPVSPLAGPNATPMEAPQVPSLAGKTAAYFTLGCKLNFSETSTIGRRLREAGVRTAGAGERADICVVNTCSVTDVADRKCRQAIHRMVREHPGAFVVVTGCYAQLHPQDLAGIEGVDLVLGAEQKGDILAYLGRLEKRECGEAHTSRLRDIRTFAPSCSRGDRTRYFLKVQDGCDYYCTYCTIPMARGRSRSGSIDEIVAQARQAAREGGREIVLTGVNIGDFGHPRGERLPDLLRALDAVEGIDRFRLSSIEPDLLIDEIIAFMAQSRRFMPHLHIPLQSGSDEVLRLMRRRYDRALFLSRVERIRALMPDAFIGVDVIVGMRGETDACFEDSLEFLRRLDVTRLHVFSYSERPGTQALRITPVVPPEVKHERSQRLIALSDAKLRAFHLRHAGKTLPVLLERAKAPDAPMHGFTPNYIRVDVAADPKLDNRVVPVRLIAPDSDGTAMRGEVVDGGETAREHIYNKV